MWWNFVLWITCINGVTYTETIVGYTEYDEIRSIAETRESGYIKNGCDAYIAYTKTWPQLIEKNYE